MDDSEVAGLPIGLTLFLLVLSVSAVAFLAASEAALLSASRVRLRHRADRGAAGAQAALRVVGQHDRMFATILATENLCIIAASALGTALAIQLFGDRGVLYATLVMGVAVIVFGEITPKTLAAAHADSIAPLVAPPIELLMRGIRPVVWLLGAMPRALLARAPRVHERSGFTGEELRTLVHLSRASGGISEAEGEMLRRVLELRRITARDVMTPRTDLVAVPASAGTARLVAVARERTHTRILVYGRDYDDLLGYLHARDLIGLCAHVRAPALRDAVHPLPTVPATLRAVELLQVFRENRVPIAAVLDEHGGTAGVVTVSDVLEEVAGDLVGDAEGDEGTGEVVRRAHGWLLSGRAAIRRVNEELGTALPEERFATLAGYLLHRLGRIPTGGEEVTEGGYTFRIEAVSGRRILRVRAARGGAAPGTGGA